MAAGNKELKCYFYQLNTDVEIEQKVNNYFSRITNDDTISTESISGFDYYITHDIKKRSEYVLFTIAKVNTHEEIKLDDIEKQNREIVDKEETQGLATDAQFLYNFNSGILLQKRGQGQISIKDFQVFISKKLNINSDLIRFNLIKDKEGLKKLDRLNQVHDFVFNVSVPKQLNLFADEVKDMNSGIELAKQLSGDSIEIKVHGERLDKRKILDNIKLLNAYRDKQDMKFSSMSIYGDSEIIDLVKHKLVYYKKFHIKELTTVDIYSFLEEAYTNKRSDLRYYEEES
ncbi:hypothetical protein [Streptococcus dentiloxodontae]